MVTVSVIIPAYNAGHMLSLGLTALAMQRFPRARFEVIVVDDASTDGTVAGLQSLDLPYDLKLLKQSANAGAGAARSRGADAAEGELLLFCDADTIGSPNYVERHVWIHQAESSKPLLVSGAARWKPLYTVIHPRMSPGFVWMIRQLSEAHPWIAARLPKGWEHPTAAIQLARKSDVASGRIRAFHPATFWPGFMHPVVNEFGERLDDFPTAWMACMGRNFSIPRRVFQDVGGFDADFQGYGQEDWELGYRLQRAGVGVHCSERVANYHQEGPSCVLQRQAANMRNYQRFAAKYPCPELDFFALCQVGGDWGPLALGRLFAELKTAQSRPELQPLTQLFTEAASRYRDWVGYSIQAPPFITWKDRKRTWARRQFLAHQRAERCLGDQLGHFATGLTEMATADPQTLIDRTGKHEITVVHMVGWPGMDGVSTYVLDACDLIRQSGGRSIVVGEGGPAQWLLQDAAQRYLRYGLDLDHLSRPEDQATELVRALKALQPNVIHCHKNEQLGVAARAVKLLGCRLVITLHAMEFMTTEFESDWRQADALLFVSKAIERGFIRHHGIPSVVCKVSTPGVCGQRFQPGRRDRSWLEKHEIPASARTVAYAGRVGLDKVHVPVQVIEATKRLRDTFTDLQVLVVGPGSEQLADLAADVNHGSGGRFVHLLPAQKDLQSVYRAATVVVGSGRVAMEALASGRPVVAYGAAGFVGLVNPETLSAAMAGNFGDHTATSVGDGLELFRTLGTLVGDSHHRARLVRFGYRTAREQLGLDQLEQGLLTAYQH